MSTDLEAQQGDEAGIAWEIQSRILAAIAEGRKALWHLAEALWEFDEEKGWLRLGYDTRSEWLADADITISRPTYDRYVRTWRKLVIEKGVPADRIRQLDQSKVAIVTDKISRGEVLIDEGLADAEALPASDLREKYYGPKPEADPPSTLESRLEARRESEADLYARLAEGPDDDVIDVDEVRAPGPESTEGFELPTWVNEDSVKTMIREFASANASGAPFPRLERRNVQIALALAEAYLTVAGSAE